MKYTLSLAEIDRAARVKTRIAAIESEIGSRFYGLENVTQKGRRVWSLAPRAPHAAIDAIQGNRAPGPDHMLTRWCNIRKAWRTVDLTTVERIVYTGLDGVKREILFD